MPAIKIASASSPARTQIDMMIQVWLRDLSEGTFFPFKGEVKHGDA